MVAIKICGVNDIILMEKLLTREISYIGMIFAESKRKIDTNTLNQWKQMIDDRNDLKSKKFIGVFLDQPLEEVINVASSYPFDTIQLHGDESIGYCKKIKKQFPAIKIIKALSIPSSIIDETLLSQDLQRKISYYKSTVDGFLLDTKNQGQRGGTGIPFQWDSVMPIVNNPFRSYLIGIAGGISAENVKELLDKMAPDFIDVNSGVEIDGRKNINEIDRILKILEDFSHERYQANMQSK